MKRIIALSALKAAVWVPVVASAGPASALPPNPVHGVEVAATARALPPSPILGSLHGQQVSLVARHAPGEPCTALRDFCPNP